jgi:hypothetical protein
MTLEERSVWEYAISDPRLPEIHRLTDEKAIGGAVWHGVKGFRNSPYGERRIGALTAIKARAPVLGGNFGVWGGLFSTFDCAVKGVRKKEDPYNASTCYPKSSPNLSSPARIIRQARDTRREGSNIC